MHRLSRTLLTSALAAILLAAALAAPTHAAPPAGFALRDGDRVVFFGDSITEQKLYTKYVEQYVYSHYPDLKVTFVNSGWGGDQVSRNECDACHGVGALARIQRDVIEHRPTVVTLLFVTGRVNAVTAVLRGAMALEGDWNLLIVFQRLFPSPQ